MRNRVVAEIPDRSMVVTLTEPAGSQWGRIEKSIAGPVTPNLRDYAAQCQGFSWERLRAELFERADDRMNIAQVAIDRPAEVSPDKLAARFIDSEYVASDITYDALRRRANQFANLLQKLEIAPGCVVTSLLGRCPELFTTVLGSLKSGAVFSPLFSAFGPEPIRSRLELSGAAVLVTTLRMY